MKAYVMHKESIVDEQETKCSMNNLFSIEREGNCESLTRFTWRITVRNWVQAILHVEDMLALNDVISFVAVFRTSRARILRYMSRVRPSF